MYFYTDYGHFFVRLEPKQAKIMQNAEIHVNLSSIIIIRSLGCMIPTQTGPKIEKFRRKSVTI